MARSFGRAKKMGFDFSDYHQTMIDREEEELSQSSMHLNKSASISSGESLMTRLHTLALDDKQIVFELPWSLKAKLIEQVDKFSAFIYVSRCNSKSIKQKLIEANQTLILSLIGLKTKNDSIDKLADTDDEDEEIGQALVLDLQWDLRERILDFLIAFQTFVINNRATEFTNVEDYIKAEYKNIVQILLDLGVREILPPQDTKSVEPVLEPIVEKSEYVTEITKRLTVPNFSKFLKETLECNSELFYLDGLAFRIKCMSKGPANSYLGIFLDASKEKKITSGECKIFVEADIKLISKIPSQTKVLSIDHTFTLDLIDYGYRNFESEKKIFDESNGFYSAANDSIEVEIHAKAKKWQKRSEYNQQ